MTDIAHTPDVSEVVSEIPHGSGERLTWAAGSFAVVIPVAGASSLVPVGTEGVSPEVWDLKRLRRAGSSAGAMAAPNVRIWNKITDDRINGTRRGAGYLHLAGPGHTGTDGAKIPGLTPERPGCLVNSIEIFSFREGRLTRSYVVLHVVVNDPAHHDMAASVAFFAKPYSYRDQVRERWAEADLKKFLTTPAKGDLGGLGFGSKDDIGRPFVISHVVPTRALPDPSEELNRAAGWTHEQVWAWRLAAGSNLTVDREPGSAPETRTENGFWIGSTWCRASATGLALVATRGLDDLPTASSDEGQVYWSPSKRQYIEHASLEGFTHRHAVDLAILTMRQVAFLEHHAASLSSIRPGASTRHGNDLDHVRSRVIDHELLLLEFRKDLWFGTVVGDEPATRTVAALQRVLGSQALLEEVDQEQRDLTSILTLLTQRAREEHDRDAARAREAADAARRRYEQLLRYLAPVVTVPALIFGAVQVIQGGDGPNPYFWSGAAVSLVVCAVAWAVLAQVLGRLAPAPTVSSPADQPPVAGPGATRAADAPDSTR